MFIYINYYFVCLTIAVVISTELTKIAKIAELADILEVSEKLI